MIIGFHTKKLAKAFNSFNNLQKHFGDLAPRISARMTVLKGAPALAAVPIDPPPRRHLLKGKYVGCYAVDLNGNWRLVFKPAHDPLPLLPDGGHDLAAITQIEIIAVTDYHDT